MTDIDEQLAKAEQRVKKLKHRKLLQDAKAAISEHDDLQRQLQQAKDSNDWMRGAIQNLINDVENGSLSDENDIQIPVTNSQKVIDRLTGILNGQQPIKSQSNNDDGNGRLIIV